MLVGVPVCVYAPDVKMFRVLHAKGKSFSSGGFGISIPLPVESPSMKREQTEIINPNKEEGEDASAAQHLFIEEALVLFEKGLLEVYHGNTKLDACGLYGMLEPLNVPLPIYLAYAHLRAQDFRVLRHVPRQDTDRKLPRQEDTKNVHPKEAFRLALLHAVPVSLDDDPTAIAFDVHEPNTHFKKSNPGIPHFHVAVASYQLPSPTYSQLQALLKKCDGVQLRIATVSDSGIVIMFGVTDYGVPDISSGMNTI
jgi:hypothetical protein